MLKIIKMIPKYFELRKLKAYKVSENTELGKAWKNFLINWNNYSY